MVKISELAIKIVTTNKRKWLTRLDQKVLEIGKASPACAFVAYKSLGRQQVPKSAYFQSGTWKPRTAPRQLGQWAVRLTYGGCGFGMSEEANAGL